MDTASGSGVESGTVVLVWPTGEEAERALLGALHSRGARRTPDEDALFVTLCAKYGGPDFTSATLAEYYRLEARGITGERTEDEEHRYRELGTQFGLDGADLTETKVDELVDKRDSGETLSMAETIALDAAYRRSKPWNRTDRRWMQARPLAHRIFRGQQRPLGRPCAARAPRTRRLVRRARARAPARKSDEPHRLAARGRR